MMIRRTLWTLLPTVIAANFSTYAAATDPLRSHLLERAVAAEANQGFSGVVLVTRGGRTLLYRAYGSVRGVPMRRDSRFWISSTGKQFTSAAVLLCQERGQLRLDDPIGRFLPEADDEKRSITIRQLLTHQSGFGQGYAGEDAANATDAVTKILAEPLTARIGERFQYSNFNYELAGAIVERASGMDLARFVRTQLLDPAGLHDTGQRSAGDSREVAPTRDPLPARLTRSGWGGHGYFSTANDLLTWYRALTAGRALQPDSVAQLFAPAVPIQEGHAALGWFVAEAPNGERRVFTRGNDDFGPNSLLYAYPKSGTVIIVLSHAGDKSDDQSWSRAVHAAIERVLSSP